jgi:hypothetical protein
MDSGVCNDNQLHPVAQLLIDNRNNEDRRENDDVWGIEGYYGRELPQDIANRFLLCCLIDYRLDANDAWKRGEQFFNGLNNDESKRELWKMIAETPHEVWISEEKFRTCKLHWMHPAHNRLWSIAHCICIFFNGDARRIWQNSTTFDVLCRLYYIGAGEQISRMIVGALKDCGQISGRGDVKADVHVCRVLGRVFDGKDFTPVAAVNQARKLYPADPWKLDGPLWYLVRNVCDSTSPRCKGCYLSSNCKYAQEHPSGNEV